MRGAFCGLLLVVACLAAGTGAAFAGTAGGWPLDGAAEILCGYAETYVRPDGTAATHTGVDIAAEPGQTVRAVVAGSVAFCGSVPASGGGTLIALTIRDAEGRTWSYSPLESTSAQPGEDVAEGQPIGSVGASGDASASSPHVHLSVRVGSQYIDPSGLLVCPAPAVETPKEQPAPRAVPAETLQPAPSAPLPQAAPAPQPEALGDQSPTPETHSSAPAISAGRVVDVADAAVGEETVIGSQASVPSDAWLERRVMPRSAVQPTPEGAVTAHIGSPAAAARLGAGALCLLVIGFGSVSRKLRTRVTAPGDTVAAAVGR